MSALALGALALEAGIPAGLFAVELQSLDKSIRMSESVSVYLSVRPRLSIVITRWFILCYV